MSSKSRGGVGPGAPFRSRSKSSRSSDGLSRRDFLRHAAVGAGALAIGGPAFAESLAAPNEKILCARKTFFVPFLEIVNDLGPSGNFQSPDIWLTTLPDVNAPPLPFDQPVTPIPGVRDYFAVVRVHNRGSAPVFNATVNFYTYSLNFFVPPLSRTEFVFGSARQFVSVQPHSDRRVLSPGPIPLIIAGSVLVVECFDSLTDPITIPGDAFDLSNDRHVAARNFL
jgi:hypothetical protein